MSCKAADISGWENSRVARLARLARLARRARWAIFSRLSNYAMAKRFMPIIFAFFAANTAARADVVIDRGSEIVMPTNAPYATRLAAEELNFFLKGDRAR